METESVAIIRISHKAGPGSFNLMENMDVSDALKEVIIY